MRTSLPDLASITMRVRTDAKGRAYIVSSGYCAVSRISYGIAASITAVTLWMVSISTTPLPTQASQLREYHEVIEYKHAANLKTERLAEQAVVAKREKEQATLVAYYATHNRSISNLAIKQIVKHSDEASRKYSVPQTLILAVIDTESGMNPFVKSPANAEGLMQIIPYYHQVKINAYGGTDKLVDPKSNIHIGTAVLKEYLVKYNFDTEKALLQYNGSLNDVSKSYSTKVLTKKNKVDQFINSRTSKA